MVSPVMADIASERRNGDCRLDCSPVTNETRLGADREVSSAARGVRWLRRRNGAVTFLKTVNGCMQKSRLSRAPSKGVRQH